MLPLEEKWSLGLAELMFLESTPGLKGNLIPIITAPFRRSSVTESVALPPTMGKPGPQLTPIERPRCSHRTSVMMLARISPGQSL